jgi:hypothetical protein
VKSDVTYLPDVLSFVTGLRRLPPLGLKENGGIVITFLRNLPTKFYPVADACFNNIKLLVCHLEKDIYQKWTKG